MRILLTTFEGGGHVAPMLLVARELQHRGHVVRLVSDSATGAAACAAGLEFRHWERAPDRRTAASPDDPLDDWRQRWPPRVVRAICAAVICGPAAGYAADTLAQIADFRPDLVVSNELLFGVMVATEATATPLALLTANVWCFPTRDDLPPFGPGFAPACREWQHRRDRAVRRMIGAMYDVGLPELNAARRRVGLPPLEATLRQLDAAQRVVLGTSAAFDFGAVTPPAPFHYAGPLLEPASAADAADLRLLSDERPNVLVAFSTAYQGQGALLHRVLEALAALPVRGIVTLGPALLDFAFTPPATGDVLVVPHAAHAVLAPRCALVVAQGGHGTVLRALLGGAPLLCLPRGRDQFDNARRVTQRGAGLALPGTAGVRAIRRALARLLAEDTWRANATRLGAAIAADLDHGRRAALLMEQSVRPGT